jgi:O-antigen/teichoic acid export membrane protein
LIAPGYTLAVVQRAANRSVSGQYAVLAVPLLMATVTAGVLAAISVGPIGLRLFSGVDVLFIALIVPALATQYFLDAVLVASERNLASLAGRVAYGFVLALAPWLLSAASHQSIGVTAGVLLANLVGILVCSAFLAQEIAAARIGPRVSIEDIPSLAVSAVHFSAAASASLLFTWLSLFAVSTLVTASELGSLKIALAVPTAAVSLMPFPQMFIFSRMQRARVSIRARRSGYELLGSVLAFGIAVGWLLHVVGPPLVSAVYGPAFSEAATYLSIVAWMVVPQLLEPPLLSVISARHSPSTLTPLYVASLITAVSIPFASAMLLGPTSVAIALVIGRCCSLLFPASLLFGRTRPERIRN